jgi:hypothetical protein
MEATAQILVQFCVAFGGFSLQSLNCNGNAFSSLPRVYYFCCCRKAHMRLTLPTPSAPGVLCVYQRHIDKITIHELVECLFVSPKCSKHDKTI